jgi:hypothetical protein
MASTEEMTVKPGLTCLLLLLPACSFLSPSDDPSTYEYIVTWYCMSPEGCEHADGAAQIDRATYSGTEFHFTSTQDTSYSEEALRIFSSTLPYRCSWLYELSFFGHDLERSLFCFTAGGFELDLSIPNEDPATHSQWLVVGRDVRFL